MEAINPQVVQQQRSAAQTMRRKLREAGGVAACTDRRDNADTEVEVCRIGLTFFCDSFFELRRDLDSQGEETVVQKFRVAKGR